MDDFSSLTPDKFLTALEASLGKSLTGLARPLPSYINRVYEVQATDEIFYVTKFYRAGRWSQGALADEHQFIMDCEEQEIPVVAPLRLRNGKTLDSFGNISFAVFPKKAGRQVDVESEESWRRVGALLGRLHNAGAARKAPSRLTLSLDETTRAYVDILHGEIITPNERQTYKDICARIADVVAPYFENVENIRIHGDFHIGNILDRVDEGLMVIDFDDMMNGPAVQDMWLLLPDHYPASKPQLELLLKGYEQFREANARSMLLIEGLRAMRMVYFTHWCSMQRNDYQFKAKFPDWGSAPFWQHEIQDMRMQYSRIIESISY